MEQDGVTYVTYANQPIGASTKSLRAKMFASSGSEPAPLLVWFQRGGFLEGDINGPALDRIGRVMAKRGYASAFVETRQNANASDLLQETRLELDTLMSEAAATNPDLPAEFYGAAALAAMEDGITFLSWVLGRKEAFELSGQIMLGGNSVGALTVMNVLNLAPDLGFSLPPISSAVVFSGAYAFPSRLNATPTPILALHGTDDEVIAPRSIRTFTYLVGQRCNLIELREHHHGDLRIYEKDLFRTAISRISQFDQGEPLDIAPTPARRPKADLRICVYTCVRNEGPFLLEWIAHNRAIGVTDFIVFSNDCDDGTTELLDALQERGIVMHVPNPSTAMQTSQHLNVTVSLARFAKPFGKSDYVMLTDIDEFIQIDVADGTLHGLLAMAGYPEVMSLSELLFGFGGIKTFENRLVTSQFRLSDQLEPPAGAKRRGVKSLVRVSDDVRGYTNHRPRLSEVTLARALWVDGSGRKMPDAFKVGKDRGIDASGRYDMARVNHYTLRSGESMLAKFARGDAARSKRMRLDYFRDRNMNVVDNRGMDLHLPPLKAALKELLADPEILRLHRICVEHHKAKIASLKSDPEHVPVWTAICDELGSDADTAPDADTDKISA